MMKSEQQLADELDAFLTAALSGQPLPMPEEALSDEARLAADLIHLAATAEPDPAFLAGLEAQLAYAGRAASRRAAGNQTPERPSFWQKLISLVKEDVAMKRTVLAFGAVAAVVLFAVILWAGFGNQGNEPGAIAVVSSATPGLETAAPDALPTLPALTAGGVGLGMGGGGVETTTAQMEGDTSMIARPFTDIFSGTNFVLNTTLPVEPTTAVVERLDFASFGPAEAEAFAAQFGFSGPVYMQEIPQFPTEPIEGIEPMPMPEIPASYYAFDGPRILNMQASGAFYSDRSAVFENSPGLPYSEAGPIAEAFLRERGLLNFPYEMRQGFGNSVSFVRLVDGQPVSQSEIFVQVGSNGQVAYVSLQPLSTLTSVGTYPLRSAEDAWQLLQSGVGNQNIPHMFVPNPEADILPAATEPAVVISRYWSRTYQPGEEVHFKVMPGVYRPASGDGTPLIKILDFDLRGSDSDLRAIAEQVSQTIHVWGTVGPEANSIELSGWEVASIEEMPYPAGTIERAGDQVLLHTELGETYILPNAPADLPDGLSVYVFAWGSRDAGLAYPVLDWQDISENVVYPEPEIVDPPVEEPMIDPFVPFTIQQVTINQVTLAYYYTVLMDQPLTDTPIFDPNTPPALMQPVWKFTGMTDTNETVEFYVPAVAPEYLPES